jgi:uncharacterized HAD superfamily protein/adenine/guanine phosphoribosyltransferase-like PRPP-binding protein
MLNQNMNYVSYHELVAALRAGFCRIPPDIEAVVGIPRSGMVPAYVIGLHANIPVLDIRAFCENRLPGHGSSRPLRFQLPAPLAARKILLVDDSLNLGHAMGRAVQSVRDAGYSGEIVTCSAIVTPEARKAVDIFFLEVALPRVFEWNIFHHIVINNACLDIDGVLCVDPSDQENDDGAGYRQFIANAVPRYLPTQKVKYIVSSRLEKYRPETELWLKKMNVRYEKLHLLDLPTKEQRLLQNNHHGHKAAIYASSGCELFIESNVNQARAIAEITKLPVFCTDTMQMIGQEGLSLQGSLVYLRANRKRWIAVARSSVGSKLPAGLKRKLKSAFNV